MLKDILKLSGAKELSQKAQKSIVGGCDDLLACTCPDGTVVVAHGTTCKTVIDSFCLSDF